MDVQMVLVFFGVASKKLSEFDWMRLIPRFRVDKYKYGAVGIELTSPWGKSGTGLGFGLGLIDLWLGWPRLEENLHHDGCRHEPIAEPVGS